MALSSVDTYALLLCLIISKVYFAWRHCRLQKGFFVHISEESRNRALQSVTEQDVMRGASPWRLIFLDKTD